MHETPSHPAGPLRIELSALPCLNWALQQNAVPLIQELVLENAGSSAMQNLRLRITTDPPLGAEFERQIEGLAAGERRHLSDLPVNPSPEAIAGRNEAVTGHLVVTVDGPQGKLAELRSRLEILAWNEWPGLRVLPEFLAAFVQPNDPAVEGILRRAATLLEESTGNPSLAGYQDRDPGRVRAMLAALYGAVAELGITYREPPASFEQMGQKVRTVDQVLATRFATCLDTTLLLAAAIEQAGLRPLLILPHGHALVGVWLTERNFPQTTTDDASLLAKHADLEELVMIETTAVTQRPVPSFAAAVIMGRRAIHDPDRFHVALDLRSCRLARIRPLPSPAGTAVPLPPPPVPEAPLPAPMAPPPSERPAPTPLPRQRKETSEEPRRLAEWRRKLVDLSLLNPLLNFRAGQRTLPLPATSLSQLAARLGTDGGLRLVESPTVFGEADPRANTLLDPASPDGPLRQYMEERLEDGLLVTALPKPDLDRRLTHLFRAARDSREEGGANTLHAALGFLHWYESDSSQQPRRAPLLLLPVQLDRGRIADGYRLRLGDDDPMGNPSLWRKLADDFGLDTREVEALASDGEELDPAAFLAAVRRLVLPMRRWEVREEAAIGLFSFKKYLMWLDLERRRKEMLAHPLLGRMIGSLPPSADEPVHFPEETRLDAERLPTRTFCPLDADSSQLRAVYAAADGASFVLEGPPGTGKSQTITNLIAHAVASGQRVLFVSEKMAALNVVHKRLSQSGLGPFCLELHSNKAQKRGVLDQLREALDVVGPPDSEGWERTGEEVRRLRTDLNGYVDALHQRHPNGLTVREAIARVVALREISPLPLGVADVTQLDHDARLELLGQARELSVAAAATGGVADNPWFGLERTDWDPGLRDRLQMALGALREALATNEEATNRLAGKIGAASGSPVAGPALVAASRHLLLPEAQTGVHLRESIPPVRREAVREWLRQGQGLHRQETERTALWHDDILHLDLGALRRALLIAHASWAPLAWWRARAPRRELAILWRGPAPLPDRSELIRRLEELEALQRHAVELRESEPPELRDHLAGARGERTWEALQTALDWADACDRHLAEMGRQSGMSLSPLAAGWRELVMTGAEMALGEELRRASESLARLESARETATGILGASARVLLEQGASGGEGPSLRARVEGWLAGLPRLREWCAWQRQRGEAQGAGLGPVVVEIEAGRLPVEQVEAAVERSFLDLWLSRIFATTPALAGFTRAGQEERIRRFRELDRQMLALARDTVVARVAATLPRGQHSLATGSGSEMGYLLRQLRRQRGHAPVRRLLRELPTVLPRLKPCFLMSPLSVAQYLGPELPPFDLVIFDEASQIPTWDAIGAIARGRRLIVVGDSRQLPPTTFFQRTDEEEALTDEEVQDLESVLDDCRAGGMPALDLRWHYRSRHESLIAFSNHHYYDGRLYTFPSAGDAGHDLGVTWRPVPGGTYDRGGTRANRAEAEALVADVMERLLDPRRSRLSIGIVTFSSAQQGLIEDLLDEARRQDPRLEPFFAGDREEPVFVKNLENVQGDERDIILFSIGYGPDPQGRVAVNFGPLNRDGGERRLNVAITRARLALVVFSSLRADQIDLARTRSVGVRHLRHFLEYAERGPGALGAALHLDPQATCESPFEEDVRQALVSHGWLVQPQVGCSGYRIDLGVRDPSVPGRFLLGVECDGATYHSGATARDRDRLRQSVLESLGWNIHRIWSTDWWQARETEIERLIERLQDLAAHASRREPAEEPSPPPPEAEPTVLPTTVATETEEPPPRPDREVFGGEEPPRVLPGGRPYLACELLRGEGRFDASAFHSWEATALLRRQILQVIEEEGPIEESLMAQRVAAAWGFERVGPRIRERLRALARAIPQRISPDGARRFLWAPGQDPEQWEGFRIPVGGQPPPREAAHLPPEEIANAATAILLDQGRMEAASLVRELARLFGYRRVGRQVSDCLREGIEEAQRRGRIVETAGRLSLPDGSVPS